MGKRLLLFGPPGVGKGTHSRRLAAEVGVPHIATGDMFREAIQRGSELGRRAAEYMNGGQLVPDDIAVSILEERLARPDAREGYLLDGFPRTIPQALALETKLAGSGTPVDCVLSLEAPSEVLVQRLAGRFTCGSCGAPFNRFLRPPAVDGKCDSCGGSLDQRTDDVEATVRKRLAEYAAKTSPLLDYFRAQQWPVRSVRSVGEVDDIYGRIREAVGD